MKCACVTASKGYTHVVAKPDCHRLLVRVDATRHFGTGRRACNQVDFVSFPMAQVLDNSPSHVVRALLEDIAEDLVVLGGDLGRSGVGVELLVIGPDVVGEVGVDVCDDLLYSACDVDPGRGSWDVNLRGHVDDGVGNHLALRVLGEQGVAVTKDGVAVEDGLV